MGGNISLVMNWNNETELTELSSAKSVQTERNTHGNKRMLVN